MQLYTGKTWLSEEVVQSGSREASPSGAEEVLPVALWAHLRQLFESILQAPLESPHRFGVGSPLRKLVVAVHQPKERPTHRLCTAQLRMGVQLSVVQRSPVP